MKKLSLVIIFVALGLMPLMAQAHATPITYIPESASVIEAAPDRVVIIFSERIESNASSITITAPDGSGANSGPAVVDSSNRRRYSVPLRDAGRGTYLVSWQVVSADDGHFTKGAFSFSVGEDTAPVVAAGSSFQIVHSSTFAESFMMWLELMGQAVVLGALALTVFAKFESRIFIRSGLLLSVAGTISYIILKSYELSALQEMGFGSALVGFVSTTTGSFSAYRLVAYIIAFIFAKNVRLVFAVLLFAIFARARVSHAAASHFLPMFSVLVNFVHLFFKELWIGTVAVLSIILFRRQKVSAAAWEKVSKLLLVSVAVAGVSGAYIIWLHLKDPSNILTTDWGIKFVILSVLALILLVLRLVNHFKSASLSVFLEAIIGTAILFVTSTIIITTPPLTVPGFSDSTKDRDTRIVLQEHPHEEGNFLLEIESGSKLTALTVTATEESKGIGPLVLDMEKRFEGGYVFPKNFLSAGDWRINIAASRENSYDANVVFDLNYPGDLGKRSGFGFFEAQMMATAFLSAGLYLFLRKRRPGYLTEENIKPKKTFLRAAAYSVLLFAVLWFSDYAFLHRFRTVCEANGDMWHQMSPMRDGKILSNDSVNGCMVKEGNYHFADVREYRHYLEPVTVTAGMFATETIIAGRPAELSFKIVDEKGRPAELNLTHERLLHVVIISEDLSVFDHIHPEDLGRVGNTDGEYSVRYSFPKAGRYLVAIDLAVNNQLFPQHFYANVAGSPRMSVPDMNPSREKKFSEYNVRLKADSLEAGKQATLVYSIEKNGQSVRNLRPYLGAAMHISIIKEDLGRFIHAHGEVHLPGQPTPTPGAYHIHAPVPPIFGPDVEAHVEFPEPGRYKLFGEFSHGGRIIVTEFIVNVL